MSIPETKKKRYQNKRGEGNIERRLIVLNVLVVLFSLAIATYPLLSIKVIEMATVPYFFERITPFPYWIGLIALFSVLFYNLRNLDNPINQKIFLFSSISLMTLIRSVFPLIFSSIVTYEPDAANYINIVTSWIKTSIDFGVSGNYQHDYPLSFLTAYFFGKLGIPVELFYRITPLIIYAVIMVLLYLIIKEVTSNPKIAVIGCFLLSICPLNYWLSVHFCPDLFGSLLYLITLLLVIRLVKSPRITLSAVSILLFSIFLLILSHHLSTLYFIVTIFGLAFVSFYFKGPLKKHTLTLLLIGIYAYTFWFTYGILVYPEFFNVYAYLSQSSSAVTLSLQANLFENFTFIIYPLLVVSMVILQFKRLFGFRNILKLLRKPLRFLRPGSFKIELSYTLQHTLGYILILGLFFVGIAIPNIFAPRVLEVLLFGLYPLAATFMFEITYEKPSRKKLIILFIILLIVMLLGVHRYYSEIQGRVVGR